MPTRKTAAKPAKSDDQAPAAATPPVNDPTAIKDPATWVTGAEPMTGAQESYVHTLARQAGEEEALPEDMTKAEASEKIEELQEKTGRGAPKAKPAAKKKAH